MQVRLENYRIIKDAVVDIEGITLIRGANDNGKSCLMRALRTMTENSSGDGQIRYGAPAFYVGASFPATDRHPTKIVEFIRKRGGSPLLYIDDPEHKNQPIEKLGHSALSEIDPAFPLKLLRFGDDRFLPNFVFQKQVPVFGQTDVYAFFASMYENVARVSKHLLTVRSRASEAVKTANRVQAQYEGVTENLLAFQDKYKSLDIATLSQDYQRLQRAEQLSVEYSSGTTRYEADERTYLRDLEFTRELFEADLSSLRSVAEGVDAAYPLVESLRELRAESLRLRDDLQRLDGLQVMLGYTQEYVDLWVEACKDFSVYSEALREVDSAVDQIAFLAVAADTVGSVSEDALHHLASAYSLFDSWKEEVENRSRLTSRMDILSSIEPLMAAANLHREFLSLKVEASRAAEAWAASDKVLVECLDELHDVTSCPVCGNDLGEPILKVIEGRN
jgi:regulator of sigma D